jgi:hypothetical protein
MWACAWVPVHLALAVPYRSELAARLTHLASAVV